MMKRPFLYLLAMILVLCTSFVHAETQPIVRVGLPNAEGISTLAAKGEQGELMMETLREIGKYTNWQFEFVSDNEQALFNMLEKGDLDLVIGAFERENMQERALYPQYLSGYSYAYLVSLPDDTSIQKNDFRSMQNRRIAAVTYASETQRLVSYLMLNNIQSTVMYVDSMVSCLQKLENGEVDLALVGNEHADAFRVVTRFVIEPFYIVASPGRTDLVEELDNAYEMILDANPDFVENLYERFLSHNQDVEFQLTTEEQAYIAELPDMRVAMADGFAPLQSFDADGVAVGIGPDIARYITETTGIGMTIVRTESVAEAASMLRNGEVDAVLGLNSIDETGVVADMVLTSPFLRMNRVAMCNKYIEYPSENMTLALVPGMEFLTDSFTGNTVYAGTFTELIEMVNNGTADYTYGSTYLVEYVTELRSYHNLQTLLLPEVTDNLAIGLRRPVNPILLTVLNKAINTMSSESLQDIVMRNTALRDQNRTLMSIIYAYPMVVVILASVLTAIVVIVTVIFATLRVRHSRALFKTQYTDELTSALNLAGFRREASRLMQLPYNYALSYSTIRNFHFVNDRYGYESGDDVLRRVADTFRADMHADEVFCRVSGGTFVALRHYDTEEALLQRMGRFDLELAHVTPRTDPGYHIGMTTGIFLQEPGSRKWDIFGMMDRANAAQQQIITSAEDTYNVYKEGMYDNLMHAQEIESRMESALIQGDFRVFLQPKVDLKTLRPSGAEALVRWFDKGRMIPPGDFIPQFERNGFIARLDRYVFTQTCKTIRHWIDNGMPVVPVSINVSRVQLYSPDFVQSYIAIRDEYAIPNGLLELEFTESILFDDVDRLIETVIKLREHGFECSIDDFGKGYSSLTMLKNIPADVIKLDAQFFDTGIDSQRDTIIVESVIDIAKALEMTTVAEGIETHKQVRLLQKIGCDMAQGYVFSRPVDIASFERYLHQKLIENRDPYAPLDEGIPQTNA